MRPILIAMLTALAALSFGGCDMPDDSDPSALPTPADLSAVRQVTIAPELARCVGLIEMNCMVVDGEFFYQDIDGFDYEPGYQYVIKMEQYDRWPGRAEPPADASRYGYRLIELVEKTKWSP